MSFSSLNLKPKLVSCLDKLGYKDPTDTQRKAIPLLLKKTSIFLNAPTGSGKTHTFLIPIFNNYSPNVLGAVIILPTLELCKQTENFVKELCGDFNDFRYKTVLNDNDFNIHYVPNLLIVLQSQIQNIKKTPFLSFNNVTYVVFDEVDMLIENNTLNTSIFNKNVCFSFISTSLDAEKRRKIREKFKNISLVELGFSNKNQNISHFLVDVGHSDRINTLKKFIKSRNPYFCLIFSSFNKVVDQIYQSLKSEKFNVCCLSKSLNKSQRKLVLKRIENDEFQYVVLSDLGARGIDFKNVSDVISFDFPFGFSKEYYLHRAGRTARNGNKGNSFIFYNSDNLKALEFLKTMDIKTTKLSFKNDSLQKKRVFEKGNRNNEVVEKMIKEEKSKIRNNKKIKPNYKKKIRKAIEKAKGKYRRKVIEKDIRRQKVERYKREAKNG